MTTGTDVLRCEVNGTEQVCREKREHVGGGWPAVFVLARSGWQRLVRMRRVAAERRDLAQLDEMQLRDMGISAEAQRRELRRPFWDI